MNDENFHQTTEPFDIDVALNRIEKTIAPFARAALFELYDDGHTSLFEQLVACLISIRTFDEVSLPAARRLFEVAKTPAETLLLSPEKLAALIEPSTFAFSKAQQILGIARVATEEYGGELPASREALLKLHGVGPKCAALSLGIACEQAFIGVDIHVHRVSNRWNYVEAKTPEKTALALEKVLPEKYFVAINRLLVPFGKHICTGALPKCSTCPLNAMCPKLGVERHR